jgi:cellulose synthase/poly-beta-1,6-N-acetylglucosamine synthase-like glycosyltransferase
MTLFFTIINISLLVWLGWGALYQFFFAFAGMFYKVSPEVKPAGRFRKTAVFIPAYREDGVILGTVQSALSQDFPTTAFEVIVLADQLKPATLEALRTLPVQVIEVQFEKSTKSKALNAGLRTCQGGPFETAVVLDADNHMTPGFLRQINASLNAGAQAVQGVRAPKNMQTGFAMLDAASESANNHMLCRGHRVVGLSARLAGSGMAFDFDLFSSLMPQIDAIGGFDKELELRLTQMAIRIEYNENAVVFDEKVSRSASFSKQRSRWIAAQFKYAGRFVPKALVAMIRHGNADFLNKAMQMTLPPRLLLPGALLSGVVLNSLTDQPIALLWGMLLVSNLLGFAIALPGFVFKAKNFRLWAEVPAAFLATLMALMNLRTAARQFLVTPKNDLFSTR